MMKKSLFPVVLAVCVAATPALADEPVESQTNVEVTVGGWSADTDGAPELVSEYEPVEGDAILAIDLESRQDWGSLSIEAERSHSSDFDAVIALDVKRIIRSRTTYSSFLHRVLHDPMTNLEATSYNSKVVQHTDFNPDQDYGFDFEVLDSRTEIQFPGASALTIGVEFREQGRDGHVQAFTTSHCDTCHVKSQAHRIDEKTSDATIDASIAFSGGLIRASFTSREHRQGTPGVNVEFDDALHPELQLPVFDNRLQYDSDVGVVQADLWPDIDKDTTRLQLSFDDLGGFIVNGGGVWAETENQFTGLKSEYAGYLVNAARRFGDDGRLRWRGRVYSIDSDSVFVDTNERVSIAGAHIGQTYEEVYGQNYDWWRFSAIDREAIESKLDYSHRFGGKAGTLKAMWNFSSIDRSTYQVLPGETQTDTNVVGLAWRARPAKGWKTAARIEHAEIDNAFMLIDGACSTLESGAFGTFDPLAPQYDEQQRARIGETTASPSSWDELKLDASHYSGSTSWTASYRYWDGENDDGDLTDWSKSLQAVTLTVWSAPSERVELSAGANWQDSRLDAAVCIPIFDG